MINCRHENRRTIDKAADQCFFWCTECGALGTPHSNIVDWDLPELALAQCGHPVAQQQRYGHYAFCKLCQSTHIVEEARSG